MAILGSFNKTSIQIRKINNIPNDVSDSEVIKKWDKTYDLTSKTGAQRFEFDFCELGEGKIVRGK